MAYEIPYDSNYGEWYGQPQDVTRLSAVLEQSLDEDGYPIGIITASWNMPDNGGTFIAQLSTDGEVFTIAETNIRQNSVVLVVEANTDYYLKIVTVLGSQQSSGVVSSLLSSGVTIVPPTPTVVSVQGGMQINVGSIPFGYSVAISISDGTDTTVLYTNNMITIYNCDAGTYTVSTAYANASNDVGTSSSSVSVTVSELATADDYVEKTSADYIKSASVNASGDTLTLTQGNDVSITFQGGGGGGGSSYTETVLFSDSSGKTSGSVTLDDNLSDYDLIQFTLIRSGSSDPKEIINNIFTSDAVKTASRLCVYGYDNDFMDLVYSTETSLTIHSYRNIALTQVLGIKCGGGGSYTLPIASASTLGGIKVGNNLSIDSNGVLSASGGGGGGGSYTAGDGIDITSDVISLETASANDIGGIKVGTNLSIDGNGVLSATDTTYSDFVGSGSSAAHGLVPAPPSTAGTTKFLREDGSWSVPSGGGGGGSYTAGDGIDITNDVISLDVASANDIGGVKVGSGLSIDSNGVLSATGGGGSSYSETELFSSSSGVSSGTIPLSDSIRNYNMLEIDVGGTSSQNINSAIYTVNYVLASSNSSSDKRIITPRYDTSYVTWAYDTDTSVVINAVGGNGKIFKVVGIKF